MKTKEIVLTKTEISQLIAERDFYKKILTKIPANIYLFNTISGNVEWFNKDRNGWSDLLGGELRLSDIKQYPKSLKSIIKKFQNNKGLYSSIYSQKSKAGSVVVLINKNVAFKGDTKGMPILNLCISLDITNEDRNYNWLKSQPCSLLQENNNSIIKRLTPSQLNVLNLICQGKTVKQIAAELHRSYHTIDNHKRCIYKKLNIHKKSELIILAKDYGVI